MRGLIHLGRLGDTAIDVHLTFVPVLLWAAWLGWVRYGGPVGSAFGVLAVGLLFGCVLAHEMAHSLCANACGIGVDSIVLLPIGGLTSLDTSAVKPGDEARIALAGPLANFALSVLGGAIVVLAAILNQTSLS